MVNLGLIKVDKRWKDRVDEVARKLEKQLPDDVQVLTREETFSRERDRWVKRTAFGSIFQMGIGIALFVGTVIVYQVLSSDLASLLPEYATMKAMGYGNRYLASVVVQQALLLSVFGFIPGYLCSVLLYFITSSGTRIPMEMTSYDIIRVFVLAVLMCCISGLAASRRVFRADPASLF